MAREGGRYEAHVHNRKRSLLSDLSGTVLDVGAGAGANLEYLPAGLQLFAVEPNPFMHKYLLKEARSKGRKTWVVQGRAEALPFGSDTMDAVVSTLVLCSICDVGQALSEIRRVLKQGGRFLFIEHVAAPRGSRLRRFQTLIRPAWRCLGDGCEPDRATEEELRKAGFARLDVARFHLPLPIVGPHIMGTAVK
jgi:ubiquinone/menaquinone biosynthesis C-methylase UbiE